MRSVLSEQDKDGKTAIVRKLVSHMESLGATGEEATPSDKAVSGMLSGISCFTLDVVDLQGINKMSQNKSSADLQGVLSGLSTLGNHSLARKIREANEDKLAPSTGGVIV
mmetsp:Transcript_76133/g.178622  ORF Transcript_76133/g.178622 Transcript_76133/m.178622 type:complete len:110 (+) Transcript_76133:24-353(+)